TPYHADSSLREMAIAPSNTSHWYIYFGPDGCIYQTTNKGTSFTKTAYTCTGWTDSNNNQGGIGYMAVDPYNENVVYASAPAAGGSFVTTNGGTNWTAVSDRHRKQRQQQQRRIF